MNRWLIYAAAVWLCACDSSPETLPEAAGAAAQTRPSATALVQSAAAAPTTPKTTDIGCFGTWIYTPASFENAVGIAVNVDAETGRYRLQFSDYGNAEGDYMQSGRPNETRTVLGSDATITNCVGGTAELFIPGDPQYDVPDRNFAVRRFSGDAFKEWQKRGWEPEGQ